MIPYLHRFVTVSVRVDCEAILFLRAVALGGLGPILCQINPEGAQVFV